MRHILLRHVEAPRTDSVDPLRDRLPPEARAVLEDGLAGNDFNRALRQLETLRHLHEKIALLEETVALASAGLERLRMEQRRRKGQGSADREEGRAGVVAAEGDALDDDERGVVDPAIAVSLQQADAGQVSPAQEILTRLGARRRG